VRDAGLIAAAQKVEHYEISGYGSARSHAEILGNSEAVSLLEETLSEEKDADAKLNDLAETMINEEAAGASDGDGAKTKRATTSRPKTRTAGH
jgi:ferritin-like metal-binding protein YciE